MFSLCHGDSLRAPRRPRLDARPALRLGSTSLARRAARRHRDPHPSAEGEPLRNAASTSRRRREPREPDSPHARRQLQRPRAPLDGQHRHALRPQRPARPHAFPRPSPRCSSRTRGSSAASSSPASASSPRRPSTCWPPPGSSSRCTTGSATRRTSRRRRTSSTRRRRPLARAADADPAHARDPSPARRRRRRPRSSTSDSHWWDGSQIYGNNEVFADGVRARRGRQAPDRRARAAPADLEAGPRPHRRRRATSGSGSALLHTLFMLEHNAICDRAARRVPDLVGRRAVRHARGSSTPR